MSYDFERDDYFYQEKRDFPTLYNKNKRNFEIAQSDYERKLENPFEKQTITKFDTARKQLEREDL